MSELHRALGDIREIRRQVADRTEFRGYGPLAMVSTAVFAVVAAMVQSKAVPDPGHMPVRYLAVWFVTATVSLLVAAITVHTRSRRMHSGLSDEMISLAVQQLVPCIVCGLLLSLVIVFVVPDVLWMLPGLWQVVFSLGVFASCRSLPRAMLVAAIWYLGTGLACIVIGREHALDPWAMGVSFAVGQMLVAMVLRFYSVTTEEEDYA